MDSTSILISNLILVGIGAVVIFFLLAVVRKKGEAALNDLQSSAIMFFLLSFIRIPLMFLRELNFAKGTVIAILVMVIAIIISTKLEVVRKVLKITFWIPAVVWFSEFITSGIMHEISVCLRENSLLYFAYIGATYFLPSVYICLGTITLWNELYRSHKTSGYGYLNMALHIVLLLIAPFAWKLVWINRTTKVFNKISEEPRRSPFLNTLFCLIIPFYVIYWTYTTARRGDVVAVSKGLPSNTAIACLFLQIFIAFIPPIIIQDKINQVASDNGVMLKKAGTGMNSKPVVKKKNTLIDSADAIKKYKELLDMGAISQEEYDKKKSELLNS